MALRQAARTGKTPMRERHHDDPPLAFAVRIIEPGDPDKPGMLSDYRAVVVLCPWCGDEHAHAVLHETNLALVRSVIADCAQGRYFLTVPAGTPIMVPGA